MDSIDPAEESIPSSIKSAFKDRLSHPVIGVFAIAWVLFNWKMLFYLALSGSTAEVRILRVSEYTNWYVSLFWPVLSTTGYILLAPQLKALASRYDRFVADKETLRAYESALANLRQKTDLALRDIGKYDLRIQAQQQQSVTLEQQIAQNVKERDNLSRAITEISGMRSSDWDTFQGPRDSNQLGNIKALFERFDLLRDRLAKNFPDLARKSAVPERP